MVKKVKADGNPCRKSANVLSELETLGFMDSIGRVVAADERNPKSEGFKLALQYSVDAAPFFIVEQEDGSKAVYTAYSRFLKDVFDHEVSETKQALEILSQNPDLDFI
ncbi:MAG: hypothetical protein F6K11_28045 [Leptolyngbya sp. SIO3F4]|nr:hypothetical protein [Leptolyngbya sp. SIO3F4]